MKHSVVFHIEELHLNINERGKKNGKGQQYELRTGGGGGGGGQEERKQIESETESMIADSVCHEATNFYILLS